MSKIEKEIKKLLLWDSKAVADNSEERAAKGMRFFMKRLALRARPNVAMRYFPVVDYIKKSGLSEGSIIEIGSGSVGITRFLDREVTGVDLAFSGPTSQHLKKVVASATGLPFADKSFDFALSLDVIEHIPPADRVGMIEEMLRVAKRYVIIGAPCGPLAERWEQKAREKCEKKIASCDEGERKNEIIKRSGFLYEHNQHGIPRKKEILEIIERTLETRDFAATVKTLDNESNHIWYFLALGSVRLTTFRWLITTIVGSALLPLFKRVGWGGYYRQIFIVEKKGE